MTKLNQLLFCIFQPCVDCIRHLLLSLCCNIANLLTTELYTWQMVKRMSSVTVWKGRTRQSTNFTICIKTEAGRYGNWSVFVASMKRQGVEVHFRHMEQSNKLQDIVFTMDSYHFNGSKVGRRFSYSKFGTTLFSWAVPPLFASGSLCCRIWVYFHMICLFGCTSCDMPKNSGPRLHPEYPLEKNSRWSIGLSQACPWQVFVEHDIGIGGVVIHPCGKCGPAGSLERITDPGMLFHPAAKIQYGGFPGSEIDKRVSFQYQQDIQVTSRFQSSCMYWYPFPR